MTIGEYFELREEYNLIKYEVKEIKKQNQNGNWTEQDLINF
jgi:hypothetical protein